MKTAIILHGMPDKDNFYNQRGDAQSNCHWLPWLQHQLRLRDVLAQTPELPMPYDPKYEDWCREFERFDLNEDTMLVGHSGGGGFLARYLSENKQIKVGPAVLVAPWIDPKHTMNQGFFDFELDPDIANRTSKLIIFNSTDDDDDIHMSVSAIRGIVKNIKYREFEGYGHFNYRAMKTRELPELLEELTT